MLMGIETSNLAFLEQFFLSSLVFSIIPLVGEQYIILKYTRNQGTIAYKVRFDSGYANT